MRSRVERAEEAALKAYPYDYPEREGYKRGYEQAEKDTIERAVAWLKENANKYIVDIGVGYGEYGRNVEIIVGGMCWEDLKKAMEE